jgi:hypothetical protein
MDTAQEKTLTELLKTCEDTVALLSPEDNVKHSNFWKFTASESTAQLTAVPVSSLSYDPNLNGATYNNISATATPYEYTTSGTGGTGVNWGGGYTFTAPQPEYSGKIKLQGKNADVEVNGVSLMGMLGRIEQRLNLLTPNTELEAEWQELRALGEQYRQLEQQIQDKQATWERLTAMPAPTVGNR